jgi:branched-chain amino acid aminotransferase
VSRRTVHWEGRLMPVDEARVSVLDAGFLYGDGIYETMRSYSGQIFALERHLGRLQRAAESVQLTLPPVAELRAAVRDTVAANPPRDSAIRLTVTRGRLERRLDLSSAPSPSLLVTVDPLDPADDEIRRRGVRVIYSRFVRPSSHSLAGVKSTSYQVSLFARNEAREAGAREALVPNESGEIVEAAAANVFLVQDGRITTPPLGSGILGGITREVVLEIAVRESIPVVQTTLPREQIDAADELFLSGTTIQVTPVVQIGGRPVGDGAPGPVTCRLLSAYLSEVRSDTGSPVPGSPSDRSR